MNSTLRSVVPLAMFILQQLSSSTFYKEAVSTQKLRGKPPRIFTAAPSASILTLPRKGMITFRDQMMTINRVNGAQQNFNGGERKLPPKGT